MTPGRPATILVVEDDPGIRSLVRKLLEQSGFRVHEARDQFAATEIANALGSGLNLLLTDVVMPDFNGRDLANQLASSLPGLRVLYISGFPDAAVVRDAAVEPGTGFLSKPFSRAQLVGKVREVLSGPPKRPLTAA